MKNDIAALVDNDGVSWLNEKYIEEELDHKKQQKTTIKYHSDHRRHRYELEEELKNNAVEFYREKVAITVIMYFRTTSSDKFRTELRFKQYDVILTKEQSVLKNKEFI